MVESAITALRSHYCSCKFHCRIDEDLVVLLQRQFIQLTYPSHIKNHFHRNQHHPTNGFCKGHWTAILSCRKFSYSLFWHSLVCFLSIFGVIFYRFIEIFWQIRFLFLCVRSCLCVSVKHCLRACKLAHAYFLSLITHIGEYNIYVTFWFHQRNYV